MKLQTLTIITVAATLTVTQRAQADGFQGTTTEFSKVNVALTMEFNTPEVEKGNNVIDSTEKVKINSKTILALFGAASGADTNEWRNSRAQLIFDWSTYQMAIADKSGTNILLYIGSGNPVTSGSKTAYFDVDWYYNFDDNGGVGKWAYGTLKDKRVALASGTDNESITSQGYFELSYRDNADTTNSIFGVGPNKEHYVQHYSDGRYTSWTDTESFKPFCASQKEIVAGQPRAAVSGSIKAKGKGSGNNTFIYPLL